MSHALTWQPIITIFVDTQIHYIHSVHHMTKWLIWPMQLTGTRQLYTQCRTAWHMTWAAWAWVGWAGLGWASASTVSQLHFCVYYTHLPCVCDRVFAKWPVMYTRCVSLAANTPQYLLSLFLYTDTTMDVYVCVCLRVYVHSRRVTTRHCMLEFDDAEMEQHTMTSHTVIT